MQLVHFDLNRELITIVHGISVLELIRCIATEESYHPRHLAAEPANPCVETKSMSYGFRKKIRLGRKWAAC
ncbi:hypothetical protein BDA96_04G011500 [Sorghum bicolor]|uniref:Uncharacterized protein n=1 Tax=Sorghum bicolor TaxID=4558 RepID=A0A921UIQ5_SORBI|nr:hypothetical protein BDA96_09G071000 [Sorghum bicolor]KAG0531296.1 hypothetical protein BDA96_04G011500 [Sorghum bicolor]